MNTYWSKMTPEERSKEMLRRRNMYKGGKPMGGLHYVPKEKRAQIMEKVRRAKDENSASRAGAEPKESETDSQA